MSKESNKEKHSIAWTILEDYKRTNRGLIVANILLLLALILAIVF